MLNHSHKVLTQLESSLQQEMDSSVESLEKSGDVYVHFFPCMCILNCALSIVHWLYIAHWALFTAYIVNWALFTAYIVHWALFTAFYSFYFTLCIVHFVLHIVHLHCTLSIVHTTSLIVEVFCPYFPYMCRFKCQFREHFVK